ncbi:MAG: nitroreductase family protein [Nitrososphaerota archaeon]|nr:nitroreductase family protein [Candidatus Calditenuaceae archaeon]MDW8072785.1 nitroreductase family protein [Nitrososphaerota archaeon]
MSITSVTNVIRTKLDVRTFSDKEIPWEDKLIILDAGRMAGSGLNSQHWRFILIDKREDLEKLADLSITGKWVRGASFAVVVLTDSRYAWHLLDAGRAITNMMLEAWSRGIVSCICTSYNEQALRNWLKIPPLYAIAAFIGFGYPVKKLLGKKNRLPLEQIAFRGRFGEPIKA